MIQKWIIGMAISFLMRQISKWGKSINWPMIKADVAARIAKIVPGEFLDAEVVAAAMMMIDVAEKVLSASEALEMVVKFMVDGKMNEAWQALRQLILDAWQPVNAAEQMAYDCVKDCESLAA